MLNLSIEIGDPQIFLSHVNVEQAVSLASDAARSFKPPRVLPTCITKKRRGEPHHGDIPRSFTSSASFAEPHPSVETSSPNSITYCLAFQCFPFSLVLKSQCCPNFSTSADFIPHMPLFPVACPNPHSCRTLQMCAAVPLKSLFTAVKSNVSQFCCFF